MYDVDVEISPELYAKLKGKSYDEAYDIYFGKLIQWATMYCVDNFRYWESNGKYYVHYRRARSCD